MNGSVLTLTGLPLNKVTSIVFCPNVTLFPDEGMNEPSFLVANASATFRGIRFCAPIISGNNYRARSSLLTVIGNSTVNVLGCLFDDLSRRVTNGIHVSTGSLVFSSEIDDIGKESRIPTVYPITVVGCNATAVHLGSGATLGESHLSVFGCGGAGCYLRAGSRLVPTKLLAMGNTIGCKCYSASTCAPVKDAAFVANGISIASEVGSLVSMPQSQFAPSNIKVHTSSGQVNAAFKNQLIRSGTPVCLHLNPALMIEDIPIYRGKEYAVYSEAVIVPLLDIEEDIPPHSIKLNEGCSFTGLGAGSVCIFNGEGCGLTFTILNDKTVLVTQCHGCSFSS